MFRSRKCHEIISYLGKNKRLSKLQNWIQVKLDCTNL